MPEPMSETFPQHERRRQRFALVGMVAFAAIAFTAQSAGAGVDQYGNTPVSLQCTAEDGGNTRCASASNGAPPATAGVVLTTTPTPLPPAAYAAPVAQQLGVGNLDVGAQVLGVPAYPDGGCPASIAPGTTFFVVPAAVADANGAPQQGVGTATLKPSFKQLCVASTHTQPNDGGATTWWLQ